MLLQQQQQPEKSISFQPLLPIITTQSASTVESTRTELNTWSLPILKQKLKKSEILKQSLLLCNRTEKWYKKKSKTQVQLQQTRLRWRQFSAVLSHDKLELFHITNLKVKRLAHVIHLPPSPSNTKFSRVRLSIVSAIDGIWSLTYFHYKSRNPITFHFQAMQLSEAHDWYMALYQILPNEFICKKPIPAYVDLFIPSPDDINNTNDDDSNNNNNNSTTTLKIRIPLDSLSDTVHHEYIYNISMVQVKRVAFKLLEKDHYIPQHWTFESVELCWSLDSHQEWVTDTVNTLLVGPQLIEQHHRLELRYTKSRENQPNLFTENYLDGLLKQWTCNRGNHFRVSGHHTIHQIYAILVPNYLFILDKSFYPFPASTNNNAKWYSSTAGLLLQKHRLLRRHRGQSAPQLVLLTPSQTERRPQFPLEKAKVVMDLANIEYVRSVKDHPNENVFEVCTRSGFTVCYEAPTTQTMLQWITHFHRLMHDRQSVMNRAEGTLWYRYAKQHSIIQSGILYLKRDYSLHYSPYLCILTHNRTMILYDIARHHPTDVYRQRTIIPLKNGYIYSGSECLLDQLVINKDEPLCCYEDGFVTRDAQTVDSVFVIWKKSKRHFIVNFREYLSLFKSGHRLGKRGRFWVFKARNKFEKEAWVCALHQQYNVSF